MMAEPSADGFEAGSPARPIVDLPAGDPADVREWFDRVDAAAARLGVRGSGMWCRRHWAPCPVLGANGLGASVELAELWARRQPGMPVAMLQAAMTLAEPLCCAVGDAAVFQLWSRWIGRPGR